MSTVQRAPPATSSLADMVGNVRLLVTRVNMADYPEYAACFSVSERPGVHLCESYALRGICISVALGYTACFAYYHLCMRPRIPFAQRALHPLHHYLVPCGGYTTPIGLVAGVLAAAIETARGVTPDALAAQHAREQVAAKVAWTRHTRYLRLREARLRAVQPWWDKALVACGLRRDRVQSALAAFAQGKDWTDYVEADGVEWVARHSTVHDARWYAPETTVGAAVPDGSAVVPTSPAPALTTPASTPMPLSCAPRRACFTKPQVDWIVSRVTRLRHCADETRWMKGATIGGWTTGVGMVLLWKGRSAPFRLSMGFGLGVVGSALLSMMHVDQYLIPM